MAEYIKREELLRHYDEYYCKPCREKGDDYNGVRCRACGTGDAIETAEDISAADVRENVHGEWIIHYEQKNIYGGVTIECSMCHTKYVVMRVADENFCRNCGADMRGENDD